MTENQTQPDMTTLAKQCAAILKKQQAVIKEAQDLMLAQKMTREQVLNINPFQWLSEVCHEWALSELDPNNQAVAVVSQCSAPENVVELPPAKVDPAQN